MIKIDEVPSVVGLPATVEVNESITVATVIYSGISASGPDPEGDTISYVCSFSPDDGNFVCDSSSKSSHTHTHTHTQNIVHNNMR